MRDPLASKALGLLALALALAACQALPTKGPVRGRPATPTVAGSSAPQASALPAEARVAGAQVRVLAGASGLLSNHGGGLAGSVALPAGVVAKHAASLISQGAGVRVAEGAQLISDAGGGLISNHGGGLISNNGGALVSNNGGALVSNNGSAYRVKAFGLLGERGLAQAGSGDRPALGALVAVVDAEGRVLADAQGKPYTTTTDDAGRYRFSSTPVGRKLLLAVAMPPEVGPMLAFLPDAKASEARTDVAVNAVSTMAMGYVLRQFVANQPEPTEVLQRLPAEEEARTREALVAAGGTGSDLATFQSQAVLAKVDALQAQAPALKAQVALVQQLLVAGLSGAGDGRKATEVALSSPKGLLRLADGSLLVVERNGGRIRRLLTDGTIASFAGKEGGAEPKDGLLASEVRLILPSWLAQGPQGRVYLSLYGQNLVVAIEADGRLKVVAGTGAVSAAAASGLPAPGSLARDYPIKNPQQLTVDAQGRLIFNASRGLFRVEGDGRITTLSYPPSSPGIPEGLATDAEGQVWAWSDQDGQLLKLQGDAFVAVPGLPKLPSDSGSRLVPMGGGAFALSNLDKLWRLDPGAASWQQVPFTNDHGELQGLLVEPEAFVLGDNTSNKVWSLPRAGGVAKLLAGLPSTLPPEVLEGSKLALNRPSSLVLDSEGRLLVADALNGVIWRRSADGRYHRFAGGIPLEVGQPFLDEGKPAREARLGKVIGLTVEPDGGLLFTDLLPSRATIRRVKPDGTVQSLPTPEGILAPASILLLPDGRWLVSDYLSKQLFLVGLDGQAKALFPDTIVGPGAAALAPDGRVYVPLREAHAVYRLGPDFSQAPVLVAGGQGQGFAGDDGPATQAKLYAPIYTLIDPKGGLLISDTGNDRVRRVDLATGLIRTLVGAGGVALSDGGVDTGLREPTGLIFTPEGDLYVADSANNQVKLVPARLLQQGP